jgi:hypothetical protein
MQRKELIQQVRRIYSERKNLLLVGPAGIGKTALLLEVRQSLALEICDQASSLGCLCNSLEQRLGWNHGKLTLIERKNRLLQYFGQRREPIVFDNLAAVPPRVARFVAHLTGLLPVWITCRSDQRKEIGHVWEHLYSFVHIEVPPLSLAETSAVIEHAVVSGIVQSDTFRYRNDIHRISKGIPRILDQLLVELASRHYQMDRSSGLKLLELDRKIRQLAAATSEARQ